MVWWWKGIGECDNCAGACGHGTARRQGKTVELWRGYSVDYTLHNYCIKIYLISQTACTSTVSTPLADGRFTVCYKGIAIGVYSTNSTIPGTVPGTLSTWKSPRCKLYRMSKAATNKQSRYMCMLDKGVLYLMHSMNDSVGCRRLDSTLNLISRMGISPEPMIIGNAADTAEGISGFQSTMSTTWYYWKMSCSCG